MKYIKQITIFTIFNIISFIFGFLFYNVAEWHHNNINQNYNKTVQQHITQTNWDCVDHCLDGTCKSASHCNYHCMSTFLIPAQNIYIPIYITKAQIFTHSYESFTKIYFDLNKPPD